MRVADHMKSVLSLCVIIANLSLWVVVLLVLGCVKLLFPAARGRVDRGMDAAYRAAVRVDDAWLRGVVGIKWDRPDSGLGRNETCLVLANHVSWSDIFLLQSVLAREGPILKFLTKRELVYVPILGIIFWAFDFPLLRRRARKGGDEAERRAADKASLLAACGVLRARPAALMNFAEGTRFTTARHVRSGSPYQHLLRPRVGGLHSVLEALAGEAETIVDVTLVYPPETSFWRFLSGRIERVDVELARFPTSELPRDRAALREWLEQRWQRKDARIQRSRDAAGGVSGTI
jgi:1-acyl-sn-glycerol-3-phosphate acyltransferase